MTREEYEKLKVEATRDLEAIERVYNLTQRSEKRPGLATSPTGHEENGAMPLGRGKLLKNMRKAINDFEGDFTIHDVVEALKALDLRANKGSIRPSLRRLEKAGMIKIVTQGVRRRAAVYQKAR